MIERAYFNSAIFEFIKRSSQAVLGSLAANHAHDLNPAQRTAWLSQIECLQNQLKGLEGWIALEFVIPRIGKRVDAIIIYKGVIYVVEFKVGLQEYAAAAADQVTDYALDLKNFHAGSHDLRLVPILVATAAPDRKVDLAWAGDNVAEVFLCNSSNLGLTIRQIAEQTGNFVNLAGKRERRDWIRPFDGSKERRHNRCRTVVCTDQKWIIRFHLDFCFLRSVAGVPQPKSARRWQTSFRFGSVPLVIKRQRSHLSLFS